MSRINSWFHCSIPRPETTVRLICFPHAGGSASFFKEWGSGLVNLELHAVNYPGRGSRLGETPPSDLIQLAREIAVAAAKCFRGHPILLFGHSMGASVAFEVARCLDAQRLPITHLIASGSRNGPFCPRAPVDSLDAGDDNAAVCRKLLHLGGTDSEVVADPNFQDLVLAYVRSDSRMFQTYVPEIRPQLKCPITTIVGDIDSDADSRPWSDWTSGPVAERIVPGNHFYLIDEPPLEFINDVVSYRKAKGDSIDKE